MPEFDVPGSAAVFQDGLDHKRHLMPFRVADVHPSGLPLAIHQDEIVLGDGGCYHRIGFSRRRDEGFGGQVLILFQVQQVAYLLL